MNMLILLPRTHAHQSKCVCRNQKRWRPGTLHKAIVLLFEESKKSISQTSSSIHMTIIMQCGYHCEAINILTLAHTSVTALMQIQLSRSKVKLNTACLRIQCYLSAWKGVFIFLVDVVVSFCLQIGPGRSSESGHYKWGSTGKHSVIYPRPVSNWLNFHPPKAPGIYSFHCFCDGSHPTR